MVTKHCYIGGIKKMKASRMLFFGLLLMLTALNVVASHAAQVPVEVKSIEIDDVSIFENDVVRLDLERGEDFTVDLELFANEDVDNVNVRATIYGYEYSSVSPISDLIGPFDLVANTTYLRKLKLRLPADVDVDDYKLRLEIANRDHSTLLKEYNLRVNTARHFVTVDDVIFSPGRTLSAGQALLGKVRLENRGQKTERDIRVTMSVPELGLEATHYIEKIKADEEEETEEFFLRLPNCAEPGVYAVNIVAWYNKGYDKVAASSAVNVVENEACKSEAEPVVVVQAQDQNATVAQPVEENTSERAGLRSALEVVLLVLVALLILVGLAIVIARA
ncbi:hypothetical protein D6825_03685, partial [Candidatus Woesearchaeota archaeon]